MNEKNWTISKDAIAKALADGTTADELAKAFSEQLNAAMAERRDKATKVKDAQTVVDFLLKYYPNIFAGLDVATLLKALDDLDGVLGPIAQAVSDVVDKVEKKPADNKEKPAYTYKTNAKDATTLSLDDLLDIFGK